MGKLKKIIKKVDPIGAKVAGPLLGGDKAPGGETASSPEEGAKAAAALANSEATRIAEETARYQTELSNINKNYGADLTNENRAQVEVGGSAIASANVDNPDQKRRRGATGLASSLGISV